VWRRRHRIVSTAPSHEPIAILRRDQIELIA
jgi:hypothetical protein